MSKQIKLIIDDEGRVRRSFNFKKRTIIPHRQSTATRV
jgi:hypothetical protein